MHELFIILLSFATVIVIIYVAGYAAIVVVALIDDAIAYANKLARRKR